MRKLIAIFLVVFLLATLATVCFADLGWSHGDSPIGGGDIPDPTEGDASHDTSPFSPDTGLGVLALACAAGFGVCGAVVSTKKLFK